MSWLKNCGCLKSAKMGVFSSRKSTNTTNYNFFFSFFFGPGMLIVKHLPAYHWFYSSKRNYWSWEVSLHVALKGRKSFTLKKKSKKINKNKKQKYRKPWNKCLQWARHCALFKTGRQDSIQSIDRTENTGCDLNKKKDWDELILAKTKLKKRGGPNQGEHLRSIIMLT